MNTPHHHCTFFCNTFTGDLAAHHTLDIQATSAFGSAALTSATGFTNHGTIRLDSTSTSPAHSTTLTVTSGNLTIGPGGLLDAMRTSGTSTQRNLNAHLDNDGQVTIRDGAELRLTRNSGVHFNDGTLTIGGGSKLELLGTGTRTLTNRGLINGTGILDVDATGASFLNSGIIAPGNSAGLLTIEGNATFDSAASLSIELGGLVLGTDYDHLAVVGDLVLDGSLLVTILPGFTPAPGDTFTIISTSGPGNEITGTFANAPGGIVPIPGGSATVTYTPTSVVLTNVVPEPSTALLLLGGISLLARRRRTSAAV